MELLLLGLLAVIIFGPAKLPEIGRSVGRAAREFKDSVGGMGDMKGAIDTVGDVRSMTPTNLAKAAMPASVKQVTSDVSDMKKTLSDPLGLKKDEGEENDGEDVPKDRPAKKKAPAADMPPAAAPAPPAPAPPVAAEPVAAKPAASED
jgi:TatA/E family protein of Tat protein translocase